MVEDTVHRLILALPRKALEEPFFVGYDFAFRISFLIMMIVSRSGGSRRLPVSLALSVDDSCKHLGSLIWRLSRFGSRTVSARRWNG